jgi:haloacetate dehalogenase
MAAFRPRAASPLDVWRETFRATGEGQAIASGHFLPEENPAATLAVLEAISWPV